MKSDSDIKRDLEAELKWDPDIDATDIAVAVKDSVVTLTGICSELHAQVASRARCEARLRHHRRR